jgi:hypothetical protein
MDTVDQKRSFVNPHIFCVKVIDIVQDNLPMYVFSMNIPFKDSRSRSNIRSPGKAVSYLHRGVIGTAVHVTSM